MKVFVAVIVLGFPPALIFSWAFEITPEGIKRESEVHPEKSITPHTGKRIVGLTIMLAVMAAGLLAFQLLRSKSSGPSREIAGASRTDAATAVSDKSVAVLPFDNLSDDKSNAYFAEGIQDEILTRLSKIAALKVISRTSTQKYKSAPDNLREIGKQLGVANVLEGSVQKIANAVHVNVQLIRAANDEHVWAESYNRKLDDVFGVEGEVASTIAEQLNAKLSGAEQKAVAEKPTENPAAYDAYLRALSLEQTSTEYMAAEQAAASYVTAVQLDPKFALAWAHLAVIRSYLYFNGMDPQHNGAGDAVKEAADRALALQPESGEAWVAQAAYRYRVLRDFAGALTSYEEALKHLPNSSFVLEQMAHVERRLGKADVAKQHYEKAAELDPRDPGILFTLADLSGSLRRFDDANRILDRIMQILPGNSAVLANKAFVFQTEGELTEAANEIAKISAGADEPVVALARTLQFIYQRQFDAAISALGPSIAKFQDPRTITLLGQCQALAGKKDDARATFERVISLIKPTPTSVIVVDARQLSSYIAYAYAGLGEKEKALEQARLGVAAYEGDLLAKPFAEVVLAQIQSQFGDADSAVAAIPHLLEVTNGITRASLRLDPQWDPLRKDPRFAQLAAEPQISAK